MKIKPQNVSTNAILNKLKRLNSLSITFDLV